jgi:hypothetical protein
MKITNIIKSSTICLYFVLASVIVRGQDMRAYIEVKDTIETAYHTYYGAWEQNGFSYSHKIVRDSIGVDSVTITRIYYLEKYDPHKDIRVKSDTILPFAVRRVYLDFEQREYKNGCSSYDSRFSGR